MNIMAKWTPTVHPAAETPPPFPPVQFLSANLLTGADILLPVQDITESTTSTEQPALLRRTSVSASNILCIETVENGPLHFWLQRKIRTTPSHGSVRAGFVLKNKNDKEDVGHGRWEVATTVAEQGATAGESQVQMVAIHKQRKESFVKDSTELAALQWVAQHAASNEESMQHVQNSVLAAADLNFTYTVMPYDYAVSPSLFEYCISQPGAILSEERARDFFRQILKVSLDFRILDT